MKWKLAVTANCMRESVSTSTLNLYAVSLLQSLVPWRNRQPLLCYRRRGNKLTALSLAIADCISGDSSYLSSCPVKRSTTGAGA